MFSAIASLCLRIIVVLSNYCLEKCSLKANVEDRDISGENNKLMLSMQRTINQCCVSLFSKNQRSLKNLCAPDIFSLVVLKTVASLVPSHCIGLKSIGCFCF